MCVTEVRCIRQRRCEWQRCNSASSPRDARAPQCSVRTDQRLAGMRPTAAETAGSMLHEGASKTAARASLRLGCVTPSQFEIAR